MNIIPFGCKFYLRLNNREKKCDIYVYNSRNNKQLPMGNIKEVDSITNRDDFRKFVKWYIETCPDDYFDKIAVLKNLEHKTIKFKAGDIFRVEYDRENYCYVIILGKTREMMKWSEFPERHSFNSLMMQPIMVRLYNFITKDKNITLDELISHELLPVQICGDNEIIWNTYPIVLHKEIKESDIDFSLIVSKNKSKSKHVTKFTEEILNNDGIIKINPDYNVYIEWGLANVEIASEDVTDKLHKLLDEYRCPYGGVSLSIRLDYLSKDLDELKKRYEYKYNILMPHNEELRTELFKILELDKNATFDDFNKKYGGMTKLDIAKKLNQRK